MRGPETAQSGQRRCWQGHEAIPVTLGVADMDARPRRIDVAHLQSQPFAQAQPQAVEGEIEHPVAQGVCRRKQALRFVDGDDVGQPLRLGRLDQIRHHPGLLQHVGGVELQAVEIEFDRAPGVGLDQVAEIVGQLSFAKIVDPMRKIPAQTTDGPRIGFDGLRLQPLELEVFEMGLVLPVKVC